jgi:predicted Zn finger-like uncharacterized protein
MNRYGNSRLYGIVNHPLTDGFAMILTCPKCSAQYRVRNESIPAEGAKLKCPQCELEFRANPPDHDAAEIKTVLAQLDSARLKLESEYFEITGTPHESGRVDGDLQAWSRNVAAAIKTNLTQLENSIRLLENHKAAKEDLAEVPVCLRQMRAALKKLQQSHPDTKPAS